MKSISVRKKQFVIFCAGILEEKMKERIKETGIEPAMFWLGRKEGIQQFYNAFNALLLYSRYGDLPVVELENQICGSPMFFSTAVTIEASALDL